MIQGNAVYHRVTGYRDDTRDRREPFQMTSDFRQRRQVWSLSRSAPGCAPRHHSRDGKQRTLTHTCRDFWRWHNGDSNE